MSRQAAAIVLSAKEATLGTWARSRGLAVRQVQRAQIIQFAAVGVENQGLPASWAGFGASSRGEGPLGSLTKRVALEPMRRKSALWRRSWDCRTNENVRGDRQHCDASRIYAHRRPTLLQPGSELARAGKHRKPLNVVLLCQLAGKQQHHARRATYFANVSKSRLVGELTAFFPKPP